MDDNQKPGSCADDDNIRSPTDADRSFGEAMKRQRIALGMSQVVLAEKIGVTFQQVQKYERGLNRVSVGRLVEIAGALETTPARLLADGVVGETDDKVVPMLTGPALRIASRLSALPLGRRASVTNSFARLLDAIEDAAGEDEWEAVA